MNKFNIRCCSVAQLCWTFVTPWTAACQAFLSFTISWSLLRLISSESMIPSNRLNLCHPLLLLSSVFSSIRFFPNDSGLCIRQPKQWSFSLSITASIEYSGLIAFRMHWLDLLAVQGTRKCLSSTTGLAAEWSQPMFEVKAFCVVKKAEVDVFL